MSTLYSISSDTLTGLADAVRGLTGTSAPLSPDDMIDGIEGHVCPSPTINPLSVTQNGEYTAPSGVDGYSPVSVSVPGIVPSGSQTVTENGTYDVTALAQMIVNVSGGGGSIESETGTWTPATNIIKGSVSFQNTHDSAPTIVALSDVTGTTLMNSNSSITFGFVNIEKLFNGWAPRGYDSTEQVKSIVFGGQCASATYIGYGTFITNNDPNASNTNEKNASFWVSKTGFNPRTTDSRYWRSTRTYKWIAIWL